MSSINCSKCGKTITPEDKFCPHCGAPQEQPSVEHKTCPKCNHTNPVGASFCEKCGTSLSVAQAANKSSEPQPNKIVSQGSYSGTMVKSKTSKRRKIFRYAIISIVLLGLIAIIVWFQVDEEAATKLTNFGAGLLVMAIFIFFVYRSAKKGKKRIRGTNDDYDWDHNDDNDYDDGGDDD